ncbi:MULTISPECIES: ubiquinone biosynthesis regulatory protein kinase UbiB [Ferrimonas]|uniref:ubiquinone biosynthesis regulatory protein kinase UbiB n=1 Tax=Ferrimonas TaxID=44011 RepID=UPI000415E93A|nr:MULTISPECIES: ubiquinone biosynthesis regulatory protein kinase UbiB [Ferrimonas]USD37342.1 ubiquinone biosynthesis regulatory protein kinase UbiB [Ferrimonas sp. SCSIO 43195]
MSLSALKRAYQIARTVRQYRLIELLPAERTPLLLKIMDRTMFWVGRKAGDANASARVKLALQSLGPVFIKFGQMLSTRRDLLPDEFANALAELQDRVPPFDGQLAQREIEQALGQPVDRLFSNFDITPLASASVAQVHTATIKATGDDIILKVVRPDIERVIHADLGLMAATAAMISNTEKGKRLRAVEVVEDYRKTILAELDLVQEASNARRLRDNFAGSPALYIPRVYPELCRRKLLVMERIYGIPVTDLDALKAQGTDMKKLAERGVEVFFTQVFRDNFFHADMHPGNIFVSREHPDDPTYIGIDCGIVGSLTENDKRCLADVFLAFFNQDYPRLAHVYIGSGWVSADTDPIEFEKALRKVLEPLENKPLSQISFGHLLVELFRCAREFEMEVQPQLVLLEKTLLYIEGLGRQLYPQLDLWQTAKPFLEQWMAEQIGPSAQAKRVREALPFWLEKLPEMPDLLHDNLQLSRQLLRHPQGIMDRYIRQRRRIHNSHYFLIIGSVLLISSTILLGKFSTIWPSTALALAGIAAWTKGWRLNNQ